MSRYPCIFIVLLVFLVTCNQKPSFQNFDSALWKSDKLGCSGQRMGMVVGLNEIQKNLVGMKRNDILFLFGKPEETELYPKGQLLYRYYISPAHDCAKHSSESFSQALEIRLNALGIASEASITDVLNSVH